MQMERERRSHRKIGAVGPRVRERKGDLERSDRCCPLPGRLLWYRGVNCIPICRTNLDTDCSCRPASIQLLGVPSTFRKVIETGHVLEKMWAGTSPLRTSNKPHHLIRACSLARGPGLDHRGCPPQASSPRRVAVESGSCSRSLWQGSGRRHLGLA